MGGHPGDGDQHRLAALGEPVVEIGRTLHRGRLPLVLAQELLLERPQLGVGVEHVGDLGVEEPPVLRLHVADLEVAALLEDGELLLGQVELLAQPVDVRRERRDHAGGVGDGPLGGELPLERRAGKAVEDRRAAIRDSYVIRRAALQQRVSLFTTLAGARAGCTGMEQAQELRAYSVQALHGTLAGRAMETAS